MAKGTIKQIVAMLAMTFAAMSGASSVDKRKHAETASNLSLKRTMLLTNGFGGPQPTRVPNQRQRRKLNRQTNRF